MSSAEQRQGPPPGDASLRVRASGVAQITEEDYRLRIELFRDFGEAMERGQPPLRRAAGPEPDVANCPRGYDFELLPDGGIAFTCIQEGCSGGECHIFTRKGAEDRWTDRGRTWVEREPFPGFVVCGCVRATT